MKISQTRHRTESYCRNIIFALKIYPFHSLRKRQLKANFTCDLLDAHSRHEIGRRSGKSGARKPEHCTLVLQKNHKPIKQVQYHSSIKISEDHRRIMTAVDCDQKLNVTCNITHNRRDLSSVISGRSS